MKNLFFALIIIVLLVGCNKKVLFEPVTESVVTESESHMIHPTYKKEDFIFNNIVIDGSLKDFTKRLLAYEFKHLGTITASKFDYDKINPYSGGRWVIVPREYDKYNIAVFTNKKYNYLFGKDYRIFVYESIYTGKVYKVEIKNSAGLVDKYPILNTLHNKYGNSESIQLNPEGKYAYNEKFACKNGDIKYEYLENLPSEFLEKYRNVIWLDDNNDTVLIFDPGPYYLEIDYRNPINENDHEDGMLQKWKKDGTTMSKSEKEIL